MTVYAAYKGQAGPDVLAFASRWSRQAGAPLEVVTVHPGPAPIGRGRVDGEWVAWNREEAERILGEAREALAGVAPAGFRALPAESAPRGLTGVLEAADPGSIAVLGSKDAHGGRTTGIGSTADRLLTGAPAPVVIVPWDWEERPGDRIRRVTAAFVDTEDGRAALVAARAMAAALGAELEVVSVVPDTRVRPGLGEPRVFAQGQREEYARSLEAAAAGSPSRLLEGPVVDALADLRPDDVDLLVVGSRGYGPIGRVLLGGVSSRLLRRARVPVAIVPRR